MSHMIYRLQAALEVGLITRQSRRISVAASVGGNKEEVDYCMAWLAQGRAGKTEDRGASPFLRPRHPQG